MQNPSAAHQKLVAALIDHFRNSLGFQILNAACQGYSDPERHGRHEPDIVAKDSNGIIHLAEAKVGEDILSETAKEQFLDFSNRVVKGTQTPVPLHIIVYREDESVLMSRLSELGLGHMVGNRIKIWTL